MNYSLNSPAGTSTKPPSSMAALKKLWPMLREEKGKLFFALVMILLNIGVTLVTPMLVGYAVDAYIVPKQYSGVLTLSAILLVMYVFGLVASYLQIVTMGNVAQRMLFNLRNRVFKKLLDLPVAFFNQNKSGDLISRINNDTDKLNQFFSQALMQFIGNIFFIAGSAMFLIALHPRLGLATIAPALALAVFTQVTSGWVKGKNAASLKSTGGLSAEIQESLQNFKVVVAFNRRDYFRKRFSESNEQNYRTAVSSGVANNVFVPIYGLASTLAQLIVLAYGIHLIAIGDFTIGLLISYLTYVYRFYDPIRHLAQLWAIFQMAMAGWDRIAAILALESDMPVITGGPVHATAHAPVLSFHNVHFNYPDGKEVLHGISFTLERGKTYALVGPTGGGKTTTASLMARLYDPTEGMVMLNGADIRSYQPSERTQRIGFILQEPFLFTGTVRDNILYGNEKYKELSNDAFVEVLKNDNIDGLLSRFEKGLDTPVASAGDTISLGQRQLIAFMRAVLRHPDLLILDEATANIDTVTEQMLEDILKKLPATTTKVIIAHRLNTIENADEIFFVNSGDVVRAGSMQHAVEMLLQGKRES